MGCTKHRGDPSGILMYLANFINAFHLGLAAPKSARNEESFSRGTFELQVEVVVSPDGDGVVACSGVED